MQKRSLILGAGQDGSFLADVLLKRGDAVAVFYRHSSVDNLVRIAHCRDRLQLYRGDVTDWSSVQAAVDSFRPDEVYNVADQDNVSWSHAAPQYQRLVTAEAVDTILHAVRGTGKPVRVFQPLSCTMFGTAPAPQNEETPTNPASPYAVYKKAAWDICRDYRQRGVHVSCGIMFNHDSPRRAPGYLIQDVCRQAVAVARGKLDAVTVGPLETRVDVGYAREYMEAAVRMLSLPEPDDFCVGTGTAWTVGEMVEWALMRAHNGGPALANCLMTPKEKGGDGRVRVDPSRTAGPTYRADVTKARAAFGFNPRVGPGELIEMLVDHFRSQP